MSILINFIFRNMTIFWDIPKWNRGQTKWDGGSRWYPNKIRCKKKSTLTVVKRLHNINDFNRNL